MGTGFMVVRQAARAARSIARAGVKALAVVLFVVHFGLTLVYVLPDNPVKAALLPVLRVSVEVYARQNWNLFAPNPISSDFIVLAKCLDRPAFTRELATIAHASDGWLDLSFPVWRAFQQNRFSAYDRLARPLTGTVRTYINGGVNLHRWHNACVEKQDQDACAVYDAGVAAARAHSAHTLRRIGSGFCNDVNPSAMAVALRARVVRPVPWSKRFDKDYAPESSDVLLGIYAVDARVKGAGLYRVPLAQ